MKYKLGEFVRFVEERREGYITRIIDDLTIAVTDDDGFEIPVLASQVTRVHGQNPLDEDPVDNTPPTEEKFVQSGIFLAVAPDKKAGSVVHFNLVNSTSFELLVSVTAEKASKYRGEFYSIVTRKSAAQFYSASLTELDQWPKFHIQLLLFAAESAALRKPLEFSEKFRAKDFSGAREKSDYLDQPAWLIQLDRDEGGADLEKLKEKWGG